MSDSFICISKQEKAMDEKDYVDVIYLGLPEGVRRFPPQEANCLTWLQELVGER